jgi:hypothetical protein
VARYAKWRITRTDTVDNQATKLNKQALASSLPDPKYVWNSTKPIIVTSKKQIAELSEASVLS